MYVCARFHEIPAKGLQDIKETKCYGRTDGDPDGRMDLKTLYPLITSLFRGYKKYQLNCFSSLQEFIYLHEALFTAYISKKVQVGKDQEKALSEKDSHSKNRGGKKPN